MRRGAKLYLAANLLIPGVTVVPWTAVAWDTDSFYDPLHPTRITIPAGFVPSSWTVTVQHVWANSPAGARNIGVYPGENMNSDIIRNHEAPTVTSAAGYCASAEWEAEAGDYLQMQANAPQATPLNLLGTLFNTWITIRFNDTLA